MYSCSVYRAFNDSITDPADNLDDLEGGSKIWIGKDYTNFIFKDFVDLDKPFTGLFLPRITYLLYNYLSYICACLSFTC